VEAALKGGVTCVQLRRKKASSRRLLEEARQLKALCTRYGVPFIVNDRPDIAVLSDADFLHVGQSDLSIRDAKMIVGDMPIGVSVKTVAQAVQAEREGAAYLGVGAVFSTSSKDDAEVISFDTIKQIREAVSLPIVLIGGINEKTISQLKRDWFDGIAVISAILSAEDPERAARELKRRMAQM
jgi:thiamine-phosphate pyrophosphorylase